MSTSVLLDVMDAIGDIEGLLESCSWAARSWRILNRENVVQTE